MTSTMPTFIEFAEPRLIAARMQLDAAQLALQKVVGLDPTYAAKWNVAAVVDAQVRQELWTVAVEKSIEAMTVRLAQRLNPTDLGSSDAFARAVAETQRTAALAVLREAAGFIDATQLVQRLI